MTFIIAKLHFHEEKYFQPTSYTLSIDRNMEQFVVLCKGSLVQFLNLMISRRRTEQGRGACSTRIGQWRGACSMRIKWEVEPVA